MVMIRQKNYVITLIFILCFFTFFRPFIANQITKRGDGYLGFDMNQDAIRQYKKALLLEPKKINTKNWLAYAYSRSGRMEEAIKTYIDSLRLSPANIVAYHELGMIYAMKKDFKLAKPYFLKASSISREESFLSEEDYDFYHKGSIRMLEACRKRLGESL